MVTSQGPCPYCSSSDAFTTYDDGGYHCFSCGAHSSGNEFIKMKEQLTPKVVKIETCPELPNDSVSLLKAHKYVYTAQAWNWVKKYGITDKEIDDNYFMWSEEKQFLIFPVLNDSYELLMWQGRYFGANKKHPKYITRGLKESVVHLIGADKKGLLVLTEDLISAIKVGRQQPAMPLWGSSLSKEAVQRIRLIYPESLLWLDYDKREESTKLAIRHSPWIGITPVITRLDPKCYSDEEIVYTLKNLQEALRPND